MERFLHSVFSEKRIKGEWFALNKSDLSIMDALVTRGWATIQFEANKRGKSEFVNVDAHRRLLPRIALQKKRVLVI